MSKSGFCDYIKILNLNLHLTFGSADFCNIAFSAICFSDLFRVLKLEMYILNKMKLNKLGIPHYGKKLNDSIVHSNDATYSKLHVPIIRNVINMLICE